MNRRYQWRGSDCRSSHHSPNAFLVIQLPRHSRSVLLQRKPSWTQSRSCVHLRILRKHCSRLRRVSFGSYSCKCCSDSRKAFCVFICARIMTQTVNTAHIVLHRFLLVMCASWGVRRSVDSVPTLSHVRHWCRFPASTTHLVRPCSQRLRSCCQFLLCSFSMLTGVFFFSDCRTFATHESCNVTPSLDKVLCVHICGRQFLAPSAGTKIATCCFPQALSLQGPCVHKGLSLSIFASRFFRSLRSVPSLLMEFAAPPGLDYSWIRNWNVDNIKALSKLVTGCWFFGFVVCLCG